MATVKVWDGFVRLFHWTLVATFAVAFLSGDDNDWRTLHLWAGYAAAALIALRLVWGFAGTPYARFSQFVRSPAAVMAYARDLARGREARYIGHNPLGGAMVVALLASLSLIALTGHLMTTDMFWGSEVMEETHEILANITLGLVGLHIAGVVFESRRHGENLARAMISGRKEAPRAGDIA